MFRKLSATLAIAGMLSLTTLSSCTSSITAADVMAATKAACAFVPTLNSITALITTDTNVTTASQAAGLLCDGFITATNTQQSRMLGTMVHFNMIVNGQNLEIAGIVAK